MYVCTYLHWQNQSSLVHPPLQHWLIWERKEYWTRQGLASYRLLPKVAWDYNSNKYQAVVQCNAIAMGRVVDNTYASGKTHFTCGNIGAMASVRNNQPTPESPRPCKKMTVAVCFAVGLTTTVRKGWAMGGAAVVLARETYLSWRHSPMQDNRCCCTSVIPKCHIRRRFPPTLCLISYAIRIASSFFYYCE